MKTFFQKFWDIVKKVWKPIAIVAGALFAGLLGIEAIRGIKASLGSVSTHKNWVAVPNDPTKIAVVDTSGHAQTIQLPKSAKGKQLTSSDVRAAGLSAAGKWTVEVKGESVFGGAP